MKIFFMKKEILREKMERAGSARAMAAAAEEEEEDPMSTHSLQISFEEKSKEVRKKSYFGSNTIKTIGLM